LPSAGSSSSPPPTTIENDPADAQVAAGAGSIGGGRTAVRGDTALDPPARLVLEHRLPRATAAHDRRVRPEHEPLHPARRVPRRGETSSTWRLSVGPKNGWIQSSPRIASESRAFRRYDASRYSIGDRRRRQQAANAPVAPSPPRPTRRRSRPAPSLTGGLESTVRAPTRAEHRHDRRAGDGGRHSAPGVRFSVLVPSRGRCYARSTMLLGI
jgi:hypothetical protein